MSEAKIVLPGDLTLIPTIEFANSLRSLPSADKYVFDFGPVGRIEPFSMLLLSLEFSNFKDQNNNSEIVVENYQKHTYAAHMGFFKAFHIEYGKRPGEAIGNKRYLPIRILNVERIKRDAAKDYKKVGEVIESHSEKMAQLLAQEDNGDLVDALTYSLREVIRNVVEHSQAIQFGYCAQYWPSKDQVEISILDRGIGVKQSLSENPHLNLKTDEEALNLSIMPGISGKAYKGKKEAMMFGLILDSAYI